MLKYIQIVCIFILLVKLINHILSNTGCVLYGYCRLEYSKCQYKNWKFSNLLLKYSNEVFMDITVERIISLLSERNITAAQLTRDLELSNSAVTEWKKGKAKPTSDALAKIAGYFNVSTDYLHGLTDKQTPVNEIFAAHVPDEDYEDLPPEAIEELNNLKEYIRNKYKKRD